MPNPPRNTSAKQRPMSTPPRKLDRKAEEAEAGLRDQAKTEIEERPYLDTEGGE